MSSPRPGRSRAIPWVVAVVVLAVLVAAAVLGAIAPPDERPEGSPEAMVQDYFEAVRDERRDALLATFTDELADGCDIPADGLGYGELSRVVATGTTVDGDRAEVRVSISERFGSGLLDASENTFDETVVLVRVGDDWRISETPWPYPCGWKEPA